MFPHARGLHLHHNRCAERLIPIFLTDLRFLSGMVLQMHSGRIAIGLNTLVVITVVLRALMHTVLEPGWLSLMFGIAEALGGLRR